MEYKEIKQVLDATLKENRAEAGKLLQETREKLGGRYVETLVRYIIDACIEWNPGVRDFLGMVRTDIEQDSHYADKIPYLQLMVNGTTDLPVVTGWYVDAGTFPIIEESDLVKEVRMHAETNNPTLIIGLSGTGKTAVAKTIHELSGRGGDFVHLNCSAFPKELIESELFGVVRGAVTNVSAREGLFVSADGGTVFLDEIGKMPPEMQPKLLLAIETGSIRRVGADADEQINVKFIAAAQPIDIKEGNIIADLQSRLGYPNFILLESLERKMKRNYKTVITSAYYKALRDLNYDTEGAPKIEGKDLWDLLRNRPYKLNYRELVSILKVAIFLARGDGEKRISVKHIERFEEKEKELLSYAEGVLVPEKREVETKAGGLLLPGFKDKPLHEFLDNHEKIVREFTQPIMLDIAKEKLEGGQDLRKVIEKEIGKKLENKAYQKYYRQFKKLTGVNVRDLKH